MIIQIYGINSAEEALEVIKAGANYIGIFPQQKIPGAKNIPGMVSEEVTFEILDVTKGKAKRVVIVLNDDLEYYYQCAEKFEPDILHISGNVIYATKDISNKIKSMVPGILIEQAVGIIGEQSIDIAKERAQYADILLLDTVAKNGESIGATGGIHDWRIDRQIIESVNIPVIVAGGLSHENVADAIKATNPAGVDSFTKTSKILPDGRMCKDIERVKKFCDIAKSFGGLK
jgi:phosphoribosylanthranilate isomerase